MSRTFRSQSMSSRSFSAMPRPMCVMRYAAGCPMLPILPLTWTLLMSRPGLALRNDVVSMRP